MSNRAEFIQKIEHQLDKLNTKMLALEADAKEAKEVARHDYKEQMAKLRDQSKLAVSKLEELKAAGDDSWQVLGADMEKINDLFAHSFMSFFQVPKVSWAPVATEAGQAEKKPAKKAG